MNQMKIDDQVGTADKLGHFADSLRFEIISESANHAAKRLILDSIGCMVGGSQLVQGRKMIDFFAAFSGEEESTIVTGRKKIPSIHAGYVNAYLANLLDFDDTYFGHPGATVIPPVLALGEKLHTSGKEVLTAVIAGYEIGIRIADSIKPSRRRLKKVMGLSTWQVFSSVVAAGKALGLKGKQMADGISLAALNSPVPSVRKLGLEKREIHWMKNNYGWAAMGGMLGAMMAQQGFLGDRTVFDGPKGFWVMAGSDKFRPISIKEGTPDKWAVERVSIKPYSACRHINPTLDAVSSLMESEEFIVDTIRQIDVTSFFELVENYSFFPNESFTIPFSAPYLIALTLLRIPTGPQWFEPKHLSNSKVKELADSVHFHRWAEADALYGRVERELISRVAIEVEGGRHFEKEVRLPKGDPRNPLTDEELRVKFTSLVEPVLGPSRTNEICAEIFHLEKIEDCAVLARRLAG